MSATATGSATEVDLEGLLSDAHTQRLQVTVTNVAGEEHAGSLFTDATTGCFTLVGPHRGAASNRFMFLMPHDVSAAYLIDTPIAVPENYVCNAAGVLSVSPGAYSPLPNYSEPTEAA